MINLSDKQKQAVHKVEQWLKNDDKTFVIAGYAGTGKTTIAKYIAQLPVLEREVIFCAYTGKAANVLREKGCAPAGTIHGFLYSITEGQKRKIKQLREQLQQAIQKGNSKLAAELTQIIAEKSQPRFDLNPDSELKDAKLVIVDEYSMLDAKIIQDLQKICKKILYLGDPFQLPPVSGECTIKPDLFLTEIHRQALESPIIRASIDVREGRRLNFCMGDEFTYARKQDLNPNIYMEADQLIVGRNNTRYTWNKRFREIKGFANKKFPQKGEKVICLKNNHTAGLFNGMIEIVTKNSVLGAGYFELFLSDNLEMFYQVWNGDIELTTEKYDYQNKFHRALERFDYAYAITCHKSQGSEFNNVVVYNEPVGKGEEYKRWQYTAITRAKNKLTLVQPS